ncbi:MAG: hypothetical protein ACI4AM_00820, partial [Muribaculaceae bacterium]
SVSPSPNQRRGLLRHTLMATHAIANHAARQLGAAKRPAAVAPDRSLGSCGEAEAERRLFAPAPSSCSPTSLCRKDHRHRPCGENSPESSQNLRRLFAFFTANP